MRVEGYIKREGSGNGIKKEGIRLVADEAGVLSTGDEGFESEGVAGVVPAKRKPEGKEGEVKDVEEQSSEVNVFSKHIS